MLWKCVQKNLYVVFHLIFITTSRDEHNNNVEDDTTHVSCNKNKIKLFSLVSVFYERRSKIYAL